MQNIVDAYLEKFRKVRQKRRRAVSLLLAMAFTASLTVNWDLKLTGVSLTNETSCGLAEHTHTDACYTETLVCGYDDAAALTCGLTEGEPDPADVAALTPHTHTADCYTATEQKVLVCGMDENTVVSAGHTHTADCCSADDPAVLVCGQEESADVYHVHTDACYQTEQVETLTCTLTEGEPDPAEVTALPVHTHTEACYTAAAHTHTEACYEQTLACTQEEHTHTADCYAAAEDGAEEEAQYIEGTLTAEGTDYTVTVLCTAANQIPVGASLSVTEYAQDSAEYAARYTAAVEAIAEDYGVETSAMNVEQMRLFDIKLLNADGNEIEPADGSSVSLAITYHGEQTFDESADRAVVRFPEDGEPEVLESDFDEDENGDTVVTAATTSFSDFSETVITAAEDNNGEDDIMLLDDGTGTTPISFNNWANTVTFEKNGYETTDTTFKNGDIVEVTLSFSKTFADGEPTVSPTNKVIQYKLPDGFKDVFNFTGSLKGDVKGDGNYAGVNIGTYVIDPSTGTITITYTDEDFLKSVAKDKNIHGTVSFSGTVNSSGKSENTNYAFPGTSTTITVTPESKSLTVKKDVDTAQSIVVKNSDSDKEQTNYPYGYVLVPYKVTVSSDKAWDNTISITDTLAATTDNKAGYYTGTEDNKEYKITVAYDGDNETTKSTVNAIDANTESSTLTVSILPALGAGESYTLTYWVKVALDENSEIEAFTNNVKATSNNTDYTASKTYSYKPAEKYGTYDPALDLVKWTVKINESCQTPPTKGWSFTDTVTNATVVGKVTVVDKTGGNATLPTFAVSENGTEITATITEPHCYEITYYTTATRDTTDSTKVSVSNTVNFDGYTGTSTAGGTARKENVSKATADNNIQAMSDTSDNNVKSKTWTVTMTFAAGQLKSASFTDTLQMTDDLWYSTDYSTDERHYTYAADVINAINESITFTKNDTANGENKTEILLASSGIALEYTFTPFTVTPFTDESFKVSSADELTDEQKTAKIKGFTVTFKPADSATPFEAYQATMSYPTYLDVSELNESDSLIIANTAGKCTVHVQYTKPKTEGDIIKQVNVNGTWTTDAENIDYDSLTDGMIQYRILVAPGAIRETGDLTLTDVLPTGMSYVDGAEAANGTPAVGTKVTARYRWEEYSGDFGKLSDYNRSYVTKTENGVTTKYDYNFSTDTIESHTKDDWSDLVSTPADLVTGTVNGQTLTIIVNGDAARAVNVSDATPRYVAVYYTVKIDKNSLKYESILDQYSVGTYTNTVNNTAFSTITVRDDNDLLEKTGKIVTNSFGNNINRVRYTVKINPKALDLVTGQSTIDLHDTVTSTNTNDVLQLDTSSVKLYAMNDNGTAGSELPANYVTVTPEESTSGVKYKFTVPDSMALVLVYEYVTTTSSNGSTFTNTINIEGKYSSEERNQIQNMTSDGTSGTKSLTVYKVDSTDYTLRLSGAKFTLYRYDTAGWTEVATYESASGSFAMPLTGNNALAADTLYALVETEAPEGYSLPANPVTYFVLTKTGTSSRGILPAVSNGPTTDTTYDASSVIYKDSNGDTMEIENTGLDIVVEKLWKNASGETVDAKENSVTLTLYQFTIGTEKAKFTKFATLTLSANTSTGTTETGVTGKTVTYTSDGAWKLKISGLPVTDENDNRYYYTVEESTDPTEYTVTYSDYGEGVSHGLLTVTNTTLPETKTHSLSVEKVWQNASGTTKTTGLDGLSVTLAVKKTDTDFATIVLSNGSATITAGGSSETVSGSNVNVSTVLGTGVTASVNGWTVSITGLPGASASYTVTETNVTVNGKSVKDDYTSTVTGDGSTALTVTNTEKTKHSLSVEKVWQDASGTTKTTGLDGLSVTLAVKKAGTDFATIVLSNGSATITAAGKPTATNLTGTETSVADLGTGVTASVNGWTVSITGLPGASASYTVTETNVTVNGESVKDNYTSTVSGDGSTALTVTNTEKAKHGLSVEKVWQNADGSDKTDLTGLSATLKVQKQGDDNTYADFATVTLTGGTDENDRSTVTASITITGVTNPISLTSTDSAEASTTAELNGAAVTVKLKGWKVTISDLPGAAEDASYTVTETAVTLKDSSDPSDEGSDVSGSYKANYPEAKTEDNTIALQAVNKENTHKLTVTKAWKDANGKDTAAPTDTTVTLSVQKKGKDGTYADFATVTLNGTSATITAAGKTTATNLTSTETSVADLGTNVKASVDGWTVSITGLPGASAEYKAEETRVAIKAQDGTETDVTANYKAKDEQADATDSTTKVITCALTVTNTNTEKTTAIKIVKQLEQYSTLQGSTTFVFEVVATKDGKTVFSNVYGLNYNEDSPAEQSVIVEGLPLNVTVTVTEIYSGTTYTAQGDTTVTVQAADNNLVKTKEDLESAESSDSNVVTFTNGYTPRNKYGAGVINTFTNKGTSYTQAFSVNENE